MRFGSYHQLMNMDDLDPPDSPVRSHSSRDTGWSIRRIIKTIKTVSVEPAMFLYMICLYYLIPAANSLYLYKVCRTVHGYNKSLCNQLVLANFSQNDSREHVVSQDTGKYMFYQTIVFTIPSTIITLLWGLYGDRKGRRLPLIAPFIGQALACSWYIIVSSSEELHVNYLLFCPLLTGMSGGFATMIMASYSHLTTVASEEYRTVRMVLLHAIMGLGTVLGSFTVGFLVHTPDDPILGWQITFGTIIGLSVVGVVYIAVRWKYISTSTHGYEPMDVGGLTPAPTCCERINVVKVLAAVCRGFPSVLQLSFLAIWFAWVNGLGEFDVLYSYAQRMGFDTSIYGYFNGFNAGVQAIVGLTAAVIFKRYFNLPDAILAIIGLMSAGAELLFLGISGFVVGNSTTFQLLWWLSPVAGMFKINGPIGLRSLVSSLVDKTDQSKLFAFISGADGILQLVTAALYNDVLWTETEKHYPSLSFFVSLALVCVAVVITAAVHLLIKRNKATEESEQLVTSFETPT